MGTRFLRLWVVIALVLCVSAPWAPSSFAAKPPTRGIDPVLLAKAKAGSAQAQCQLGMIYDFGDGVRTDYAQAEAWYRKAAQQGNPDAQFMLGGLYHFGHGVPQDSDQAFAWIMKAAQQGHTDAEFFISTCYSEGWGVAKDDAQAMVWLRKGAEQGHATSQYMLGWAYEAGDVGVPQDYVEAYYWLTLAASGENTHKKRIEAFTRRESAASHLASGELSRVQTRLRNWYEQHPATDQ